MPPLSLPLPGQQSAPIEEEEVKQSPEEDKPSEDEIKYWSAVKENPSDFSSWTQLLQLVEQKVSSEWAWVIFSYITNCTNRNRRNSCAPHFKTPSNDLATLLYT